MTDEMYSAADVERFVSEATTAERERCQAIIRDDAAKWRDSAIKSPDADRAAEWRFVAYRLDAAADLLDGAS